MSTKEQNLRKDMENIDLKMKKLQMQKNILIMTLNSLLENKTANATSSAQPNDSSSVSKSNLFGN